MTDKFEEQLVRLAVASSLNMGCTHLASDQHVEDGYLHFHGLLSDISALAEESKLKKGFYDIFEARQLNKII